MKRLMQRLIVSSLMVATAAPLWAADTYIIDPKHTNVEFSINHFGFSSPNGKFNASEGKVVLDTTHPEASSVTVTFPISSLVTGLPDLDKHLLSKDFFDVAQFPTASFTSTSVEVTGKDTATVNGTLTLHGVTKPVALSVKLNKIGQNMMKKQTAGFSASAAIKRSDFGITAYLPNLGDDVILNIQCEANM